MKQATIENTLNAGMIFTVSANDDYNLQYLISTYLLGEDTISFQSGGYADGDSRLDRFASIESQIAFFNGDIVVTFLD